jgi:hypothetical protein
MPIKTSTLRQDIYRLLDQVLESGKPIEISRKGHLLEIALKKPVRKVQNLKKRKVMTGDPDSIVHLDWSEEWKA